MNIQHETECQSQLQCSRWYNACDQLFHIPRNHLRNDNLGHFDRSVDVNLDNVLDDLVALQLKGSGDFVVGSNIID